ncbi:MAG: metal-dependent hydrolase [Myxococcales bacterium]|nr:metal-dependent hydrolase [Myxococcales bacterium]
MTTAAATARSPIPIRRMDFELTDDIPEHWGIDGNPFLTALMSALSASFPAGERYFIHSVNHYVDQLGDDPELRARVRGFAGQEAQHTKEHLAFNRFLDARGVPALAIEQRVEEILDDLKRHNTPAENLAHTVALEHLTAFLASAALESPEAFFGKMHPTVAAFWGWHLIEELEHRSVAFDVYQRCVGDEKLRLRAMAIITVFFTAVNLLRTARVMRATGHRWDLAAWAKGLNLLFGRPGVLRKMSPLYRAFYRTDFHPDQHQVDQALDQARAYFLPGHERTTG